MVLDSRLKMRKLDYKMSYKNLKYMLSEGLNF